MDGMKRVLIGVLAASTVAVGAGSAQANRLPDRTQVATLLTTVKVKALEFRFVLSAKTAKRGIVIFKVTNAGKLSHDFEISGRKTRLISPGATATLRVTFLRKGSYPYKCTVPGHAALGMKGAFTIT
jgi:uncharacterized cupredoxin-like copper-binding protein